MNKKAYVFSVLAMLVIAIIFSLLVLRTEQAARSDSLQAHILSANTFLEQFEQDLPRAISITGYRSLLGLDQHVSSTGSFLNNFSASFQEIILNGTVNESSYEVMDDATLGVFQERMQDIAGQVGIGLDIQIISVSAKHTTPFDILVTAQVQLVLQTRDASTQWNYTRNVSSEFSIAQLRDPLYTIGSAGRLPTVVRPVNVSRPFITTDNDTTNLQIIFNESLYQADTSGPSFLMRFEGIIAPHEHGIASLVDTQALDAQDIPVFLDRSVVDYAYFGSGSTTTNTIVNMPAHFLLADEHLAAYDAEDKTT